jgi:hypothetical protein
VAAGAAEAPALAGAAVTLAGARLLLRPAGSLYWPAERLVCVADLHLGRGERLAREGGALLPPYATTDTLDRLEAEIAALGPRQVVCLGDSFDDLAAADELAEAIAGRIRRLCAGRQWVWIAGNHDPGPVALPGTHRAELRLGPLVFRHIAGAAAGGEVSGHFHPKARLVRRGVVLTRRCFLADGRRLILPAFGTYTGGLDARDAAFDALMGPEARAYLVGREAVALPRARLGA